MKPGKTSFPAAEMTSVPGLRNGLVFNVDVAEILLVGCNDGSVANQQWHGHPVSSTSDGNAPARIPQ
jgi:hypothetical protein